MIQIVRMSGLCLAVGLVAVWSLAAPECAMAGGEGGSMAERVEAAAQSTRYDGKLFRDLRRAPRAQRMAAGKRLLTARCSTMRGQAVDMLRAFPPDQVRDAIRPLLKDANSAVRCQAARYLAERAKSAEAWDLLIRQTRDRDPGAAVSAVKALALLRGPKANAALRKLLEDETVQQRVRDVAILCAGSAEAKECVPALAKLLDHTEPSQRYRGDRARVCDVAATALESMFRVYRLGEPGAFLRGDIAKRDKGIREWKAWRLARAAGRTEDPRQAFLDRLLRSSLDALARDPDAAERKKIRRRLQRGFRTSFCLGYLPGADAILRPVVLDQWRILRTCPERTWYRHTNGWGRLRITFERGYLRNTKDIPSKPDAQALAFIKFAASNRGLGKAWVWSLCRSFDAVFPKSPLAGEVAGVRTRLEAAFAAAKKRIVLHGSIAVLEPKPGPQPRSNMVMGFSSRLWRRLQLEPSNWQAYSDVIEYLRMRHKVSRSKAPSIKAGISPVVFEQQLKMYAGNEWPYLGNAAYHWRVGKNAKRAIEFVDKALILNPGNAKAYALRGMIRAASGASAGQAEKELTRAFDLDPKSLGGEPETTGAVLFLARRFAEKGKAAATPKLRELGSLKAADSDEPMSRNALFQDIVKQRSKP